MMFALLKYNSAMDKQLAAWVVSIYCTAHRIFRELMWCF